MEIEIVTTYTEGLKESGFGSMKACKSVENSIRDLGHSVRLSLCKSMQDLDEVVKRKPKLVILAVKYILLDDKTKIWLSQYFAKKRINFSGSSRDTLEFDSDKALAKAMVKNAGIPTANYFTAIPGEYESEASLPFRFPLFLKPLSAANGNGVDEESFVTSFAQFEGKVTALHDQYGGPILVEEYLDGREFTVAIISTKNGELMVSPIEIVPLQSKSGLRILGQAAKKENGELLKRTQNNELTDKIKKLAIESFIALGIKDFGRIDVKANKFNECFFMEANMVPGMSYGSSYFPIACEIEHQLSYSSVIQLIVEKCLSRISSSKLSQEEVQQNGKFSPPALWTEAPAITSRIRKLGSISSAHH